MDVVIVQQKHVRREIKTEHPICVAIARCGSQNDIGRGLIGITQAGELQQQFGFGIDRLTQIRADGRDNIFGCKSLDFNGRQRAAGAWLLNVRGKVHDHRENNIRAGFEPEQALAEPRPGRMPNENEAKRSERSDACETLL